MENPSELSLERLGENLEKRGYKVSILQNGDEVCSYLEKELAKKSVGIGGSVTVQEIGLYDRLIASKYDQAGEGDVFWHWKSDDVKSTQGEAAKADVYISSVGGVSMNGEMVNIDGYGNRLASTLYGHQKVYFIIGKNKVTKTLDEAISRTRNVSAVANAKRLGMKTPCTKGGRCFDCNSSQRICSATVIYMGKMASCDMEVILVNEEIGY